jgi:hypothetical protein
VSPALPLILCAAAWAAEPAPDAEREKPGPNEAVVSEDFVIKGKKAGGPAVWVPQPGVEKPVIDEVIQSLDIVTKDHKPSLPRLQIPAEVRKLHRPFPTPPLVSFDPEGFARPYREWMFEIVDASDERVVWQTEGTRRVVETVTWDGRDGQGHMAARVGGRYYFRFTGTKGDEGSTLVSEPVEITSLDYTESMGNTRLEVANSLIFGEKSEKLLRSAAEYLNLMAAALARAHPKGKDAGYQLELHHPSPEGKLAKARAKTLRSYLSAYLVVMPSKIAVDVQPPGERGDITACVLPPGKGAAIRPE